MPTQMNYSPGGGKYRTAPECTTPAKSGQINYRGEPATRKSSRSRPQMNFSITADVKVKSDPGQGQRSGTGSQGGY
jgi:ABC-type uncharacterized transport system involved in gliding motility auxiliary subunit